MRNSLTPEEFNRRFNAGQDVFLIKDNGEKIRTKTRSEAFFNSNQIAVIFVEGEAAYWRLDRVIPFKEEIVEREAPLKLQTREDAEADQVVAFIATNLPDDHPDFSRFEIARINRGVCREYPPVFKSWTDMMALILKRTLEDEGIKVGAFHAFKPGTQN